MPGETFRDGVVGVMFTLDLMSVLESFPMVRRGSKIHRFMVKHKAIVGDDVGLRGVPTVFGGLFVTCDIL